MSDQKTLTTTAQRASASADANQQVDSQCPECDGRVVPDESRGEHVCEGCGLVISEDEIDHGPEWRAFDSQEREEKSRVGAPSTVMLHDKGLSTEIDWKDKDGYGRSLSSRQRRKMNRLRKWNKRSIASDSTDRRLREGIGEIDRMCASLGLSDNVKKRATKIYRLVTDEGLLPGRSIEGMTSGALLISIRQHNSARTLTDVSEVSRVEKNEIGRDSRYISRELGVPIPPPSPKEYMPSVASETSVSDGIRHAAEQILDKYISEGKHSGKSPRPVAAAALYTATKLVGDRQHFTQGDAAEIAQACEVTIRSRYQEMAEMDGISDIAGEAMESFDGDGALNDTATGQEDTGTTSDEAPDAPEATGNIEEAKSTEMGSHDDAKTDDFDELTIDVNGDQCIVRVPNSVTQSKAMLAVVEHLLTDHGLDNEIETPYKPPKSKNYLIVDDPDQAPDQSASWHDLSNGWYLNTKLDKAQKKHKIGLLTDICNVEISLNGW